MALEDDLKCIEKKIDLIIEVLVRDIPEDKRCFACKGLGRRLRENWEWGHREHIEYSIERCYHCGGTGRRKEEIPDAHL